METFNSISSEFRSLRDELESRPNHRFSSTEIEFFLREVLPQLGGLHQQGQYHGSISLDTLVIHEGNFRLLASDDLHNLDFQAKDDILALGYVALQMLTGKQLDQLRNANGIWMWEDYCLVDDRLKGVINQMIENIPKPAPLNSVGVIVASLNGDSPPATLPPLSPQGSQPRSPQARFPRLKRWHWGILGLLCGCGIVATAIPILLEKKAEAKQIDAVNNLVIIQGLMKK